MYFYSERRKQLLVLIIELIAASILCACVNVFTCVMMFVAVAEEEQRSLGWSYYKVFEPTKSSPYSKETVR